MTTEPGALGRRIAAQLTDLTLHKVTEAGFRNAERNAACIATGRDILALRQTSLVNGNTAIVMGAGPSLHLPGLAAKIRAHRDEIVLIVSESVLAFCFRNELVPDLMVSLDPHPTRIVRCLGDPTLTPERLVEDDYFARQDFDPAFAEDQLRFNGELHALVNAHGRKIRAALSSSAAPALVDRVYESGMAPYWWNPFYDDYDREASLTRKIHRMNGLPCLNGGGNVGSAAWVIAHAVLGKTRIGLVGMDLGYYADTPYEKTQYYYELVELVGSDRLDEVFVRIHNPYLDTDFYTDPAYLWYRDCFLEMARQTECDTYNCTEGGILFGDGVHFVPLGDFLAPQDERGAGAAV